MKTEMKPKPKTPNLPAATPAHAPALEWWPVDRPVPYARNPRRNDGAVDALAASIREFGFRSPVLVDAEGVVIAGHTRLKAARKLGLREVPVLVCADLPPEKVAALRLADNKTAELAEWDTPALDAELAELASAGVDMEPFGFGDELAALAGTEGQTDEDAVPEPPPEPFSRRGAVYALGRHRLMCGDSTSAEDVARLMGDDLAALWLTDPPYNVDYHGSDGKTIQNDSMEDAAFRDFLKRAFECAKAHMAAGAPFYIFHADSEGYNFHGSCHDVGLTVRQCLVWKKNRLVLGRQDYKRIYEPCLYGWKDGAAHPWYSDHSQTTVLESDKPKKNDLHPTMKPVEMLVYLLKNSSKRGDLVMDTFAGSGSTLIACEQTGRVCRTMELEPKYCDVIRRRWAEFVHGEGCDWQTLAPEVAE
jgi:site-specific DNA-methyltransferase (adenine-specific)